MLGTGSGSKQFSHPKPGGKTKQCFSIHSEKGEFSHPKPGGKTKLPLPLPDGMTKFSHPKPGGKTKRQGTAISGRY